MNKILLLATFAALTSPAFARMNYQCPSPDQIRCVPQATNIGDWIHNGSVATGNTFAPNNQCANVISLSANQQRLICCYEKCGVFIRDVRSRSCAKLNESTFQCR